MLDISFETFEWFRSQTLREMDLLASERRRIRAKLLREQGDRSVRSEDEVHHNWIVLREGMLMDAIHRLDEDIFGTCAHCRGPIGKERLMADVCQQLCSACGALRAT